jgi:menaquinol-cytochrome c reductase iron-sulfur subunit
LTTTRREFYRLGSFLLGVATSLVIAVPGLAYVLDPLRRRGEGNAETTRELTRLSGLKVGVPASFSVVAGRKDSWVKYPPEPVGTVWLVRQPEGAKSPVVAFTAECPHLGCAISTGEGGKSFVCPCHQAKYGPDGVRKNQVSPRPMDTLEVELTADEDPGVVVHFRRFRNQIKEKKPLV